MLNTHSRYGDCRMELLASHAALAGASRETVAALFAAPTTVQAGDILDQKGLLAPVMASLAEKTEEVLCRRAGKAITAGAAAYLPGRGIILWTKNARAIWENLQSTEETI